MLGGRFALESLDDVFFFQEGRNLRGVFRRFSIPSQKVLNLLKTPQTPQKTFLDPRKPIETIEKTIEKPEKPSFGCRWIYEVPFCFSSFQPRETLKTKISEAQKAKASLNKAL